MFRRSFIPVVNSFSAFTFRSMASSARASGKVKWFDRKKGFGFITPDASGEDVFVHYSNINVKGFRALNDGEVVEYECVLDEQKGKKVAVNVTGPNGAVVLGSRRPEDGERQ